MCNLYSHTRAVDAMRQLFADVGLDDGGRNLAAQPAIYPDHAAPVVVRAGDGLRLDIARWGLPTPQIYLVGKKTDRGVTNIRNPASSHWRKWLAAGHRCLVPFDRFAEPCPGGQAWFGMRQDRPAFFAGIIVRGWTSVRKLAAGEETADLYGFLTTEPNRVVAAAHPKAMPVILSARQEWNTWLSAPWAEASALQRPVDADLIERVA